MADDAVVKPFPPVSLEITWADLLGWIDRAMLPAQRRERWEQWLAMVKQEDPACFDYWTSPEGCIGCRHLDGHWCTLQELPCTVNPIFSMRMGGGVGMACMGLGWTCAICGHRSSAPERGRCSCNQNTHTKGSSDET